MCMCVYVYVSACVGGGIDSLRAAQRLVVEGRDADGSVEKWLVEAIERLYCLKPHCPGRQEGGKYLERRQ